jgi:hypothetical protein
LTVWCNQWQGLPPGMHPSHVWSVSSDRLSQSLVMVHVLVQWCGPIFNVEGECWKPFCWTYLHRSEVLWGLSSYQNINYRHYCSRLILSPSSLYYHSRPPLLHQVYL